VEYRMVKVIISREGCCVQYMLSLPLLVSLWYVAWCKDSALIICAVWYYPNL